MKLNTKHFGTIEIDEHKAILFKEGIPGFETLTQFALIEEEENPFSYLQALEDGEVAFAIINPYLLKKDYTPRIPERYFERLGGGKNEEFTLFVIATVLQPIDYTTVNLQAPILIHVEKRVGVQAIVEDSVYKTRHRLVDLITERS